jgi:hypothetical protein
MVALLKALPTVDALFTSFSLVHFYNDSFIMYLTRSEYDRGVNTFSPEGRLFQASTLHAIPCCHNSCWIGLDCSETHTTCFCVCVVFI